MSTLRPVTLLFLIKRQNGLVSELCLAMKKRGFGMGKWNGVGGKIEPGETIEEATKREVHEEIGVEPNNLIKVAELSFYFPHNPAWDLLAHVYFSEEWEGAILESEEMRPEWFAVEKIPFDTMWSDDSFWLPEVLAGKKLTGTFSFDEAGSVTSKQITFVQTL
jgi:mutator protein MutT